MRRLALILGLLWAGTAAAQTTTFNGVVKDLTSTPVPTGQITFTLKPSIDTTTSGSSRFVPTTTFCEIHNPAVVSTSGTGTITVVVGTAQTWLAGDVLIFSGTADGALNNTVATAYAITLVNSTTSFNFTLAGTHTNGAGGTVGGLYASGGTGVCAVMQNTALTPANTSYSVGLMPIFSLTSSFNTYAIGAGPVDISTVVPTPSQMPAYSFLDLFSTQTITGAKTFTNGILNVSSLTMTTGNVDLAHLGNRRNVCKHDGTSAGWAGADVSVWIAAAIADIVANSAGLGTVDATDCVGAQTISQEIDVGNNAVTTKIALLLPPTGTWTITITDGVSCGIKQFNQTSIVGNGPITVPLTITGSASANLSAFYCTDPNPVGGGSYVRLEGVQFYNPSGSTVTSSLMHVYRVFDNALFNRVKVANYSLTDGLLIEGACCGTSFTNVTVDGNNTGGNQVHLSSATLTNRDVNFYSLSADHPSAGLAGVLIDGTNAAPPTDATNTSINFYGSFYEAGTSATTTGFKIKDARNINFYGVKTISNGGNHTGFDISQTATNQVRNIYIQGYDFTLSSGTGINDHISGHSFLTAAGYVSSYLFGGSTGVRAALPTSLVDNELNIYDVGGNLVFNAALNGNPTSRSFLDAQGQFVQSCGLTAAQVCLFTSADRGTGQWGFGSDASNNGIISDRVNFKNRMTMPLTASTVSAGGIFRFLNTECPLGWENNAASGNLQLCKNTSDQLTFNALPVPQVIASGTATMTTGLIATLACGTTVTVTATGALTTDAVTSANNAAVVANNGVLIINAWPTAGNVNFNYCNPTAAGITPTAATLNWRLVR
jgi:hypothetical protein